MREVVSHAWRVGFVGMDGRDQAREVAEGEGKVFVGVELHAGRYEQRSRTSKVGIRTLRGASLQRQRAILHDTVRGLHRERHVRGC